MKVKKLNVPKLQNYIVDIQKISGDVVQFGLNDLSIFKILINGFEKHNKKIYGFYNNWNNDLNSKIEEYKFNIIPSLDNFDNLNIKEISFAFIDTVHPNYNIDEILKIIYPLMSFGATIYFSMFDKKSNSGNNKIIKNFINENINEITQARQIIVNNNYEVNLIIKCFPNNKKPILNNNNKESLSIVTVFKIGGVYDVSYVNHIANSIKENVNIPYKFICMTDHFEGYSKNVHSIIPFDHNFPKWWGKIELFSPGKFGTDKIFYLDLDTLIIKNIDHILSYSGKFLALRNFYNQFGLGSGIMMWKNYNPKVYQIYEKFMESCESNIKNHLYGDQEFIEKSIKSYDYIQDLYNGEIVSYKKDCINRHNELHIPENARIICFHGPPRPHEINIPGIKKYWK
jgi:hypothetical protein